MNNTNLEKIIVARLRSEDFAQPAKTGFFRNLWRKLCAAKTA